MSWLLMDMGNSRCKCVITNDEQLRWQNRLGWDNQNFAAEHWLSNLKEVNTDNPKIKQILVSSVASEKIKQEIAGWCETVFAIAPLFVNSQDLYDNGSRDLLNSYDEPLALGVDRWLAMIGAFERTDKAFAVFDAGTAITLDLVNAEGEHLGGHIVPGAKLMQKALFGDTGKIAFGAKLDSNKADTEQWLGINSLQAVELGTYQAALGYLQSCLERLNSHYGIEQIFVCGGDGANMMKQIKMPKSLEWRDCPDLIFEGLYYQGKNG